MKTRIKSPIIALSLSLLWLSLPVYAEQQSSNPSHQKQNTSTEIQTLAQAAQRIKELSDRYSIPFIAFDNQASLTLIHLSLQLDQLHQANIPFALTDKDQLKQLDEWLTAQRITQEIIEDIENNVGADSAEDQYPQFSVDGSAVFGLQIGGAGGNDVRLPTRTSLTDLSQLTPAPSDPNNVTATATGQAISTGQGIALNSTTPESTTGSTVGLGGNVNLAPFLSTGSNNNVAVIVDISGSTTNAFNFDGQGSSVGDLNSDGRANTILDGEVASILELNQSFIQQNLGNSTTIGLIPFNGSANILLEATPNTDTNTDGEPDVETSARTLRSSGGTNFQSALNTGIQFFTNVNDPGETNLVFFLSDGFGGGNTNTATNTLTDPAGINAQIRAIGIGDGANFSRLDLVDDGVENQSAASVSNTDSLSSILRVGSGAQSANIQQIDILVNGELNQTLPPGQLVNTASGLGFSVPVTGLNPGDNTVEVRVILDDGTVVATTQVIQGLGMDVANDSTELFLSPPFGDALYHQLENSPNDPLRRLSITGISTPVDLFPYLSTPTVDGDTRLTAFNRTTFNLRAKFNPYDELLTRVHIFPGDELSHYIPGIASQRGPAFYGIARNDNPIMLDKVRYRTSFGSDNFQLFVGPRIDLDEFIDTNPFANDEERDFSNGLFINNPLVTYLGKSALSPGAGIGFDWALNKDISLRAGYVSADEFGDQRSLEIFGDNRTIVTELEFSPTETFALSAQYANFSESGRVLGAKFNGIFGDVSHSNTNVIGLNAAWQPTKQFGLFGRVGFGWSDVSVNESHGGTETSFSELNSLTYQLGASYQNLFKTGDMLGISFGQPLRVTDGDITIRNVPTSNGLETSRLGLVPSGTETNLEVFYRLPVNDWLTLTPNFQLITNPNNIANNPTVGLFSLRTVMTF